ncbi:MAG TPA: SRPBCC domain-containing protein [Chitinophagaceae bacterium]|nr:SRPBCC domain-containing protein [Chitinophagaceae bacterium]
MQPEKLEIRAALRVARPVKEVFEAIVDPVKMSRYFIEHGSGRLEAGKTVTWKFPEFDMLFDVKCDRADPPQFISFSWDGASDGQLTRVDIELSGADGNTTLVVVTEKEKMNDEAGIRWLKSNTEGWANFLACLKAYLEYGINLRENSFDSSQLPTKDITV